MVQKAYVLGTSHRRAAKYQTCATDGACTNGQGQRDRFLQSLFWIADLPEKRPFFLEGENGGTEKSPRLIFHQRDAAPAPRAVRHGRDYR
jgi:hypothetical protein